MFKNTPGADVDTVFGPAALIAPLLMSPVATICALVAAEEDIKASALVENISRRTCVVDGSDKTYPDFPLSCTVPNEAGMSSFTS